MSSILEAIGNSPLVDLSRLTRSLSGRILLKLDYLNPGFSKKDRAALWIIDEAERSGALRPGQTVVELTSGNMGTGLAIICAVKGRLAGKLYGQPFGVDVAFGDPIVGEPEIITADDVLAFAGISPPELRRNPGSAATASAHSSPTSNTAMAARNPW